MPTDDYPYNSWNGRVFEQVTETSGQGILPGDDTATQDFYKGKLSGRNVWVGRQEQNNGVAR